MSMPQQPVVASPRNGGDDSKVVYWREELPPLNGEVIGEYTMEATSERVPGTLAHRDELWDQCYDDLMRKTCARLEQEVVRLGGDYAHVRDESIESKHNAVTGEAWLHGQFTYALFCRR